MKLKPIGLNRTEIDTGRFRILYSYSIPVASYSKHENQYFRTHIKYSVTTSRHINSWIGQNSSKMVRQAEINSMASGKLE